MSDANLPVPLEPAPVSKAARWGLIRDLVVFQIKLIVDGCKDLVLGPLSLVAGILDLVRGSDPATGMFRSVLTAGSAFDRWVGLFAAVERGAAPQGPAPSLDEQLRQLELLLVEQHRRGGITADAKQVLDHALDLIEGRLRAGPAAPSEPAPARDDIT